MIVYFKTPIIRDGGVPEFTPAKSVSWDLTKADSRQQMSTVLAMIIKRMK